MAEKKRVLVADDDPSPRTALARQFKQLGYQVDTAQNYLGTKELLEQNRYVLIVCDGSMPISFEHQPYNRCGLELLAFAKLSDEHVNTPFVINTGDDTEETKRLVAEFKGIYRHKTYSDSGIDFFKKLLSEN